MPIQPMAIGYDPIPDVEDVTPIDGSIARQSKKSNRNGYLLIGTIIILIILFLSYRVTKVYMNDVRVYQTSMEYGDTIHLLNEKDMSRRGFDVGYLSFGNTMCGHISSKIGICNDPGEHFARIDINPQIKYQSVLGFGGAFTEASAHNFFQLPSAVQEQVLELYFGKDGIGFSMGRIHINSCDFSLETYSFDNVDNDFDLLFFDDSVAHDTVEIIPFLKRAIERSSVPIKLVASPWSPPAWMKVPQPVKIVDVSNQSNAIPVNNTMNTSNNNNNDDNNKTNSENVNVTPGMADVSTNGVELIHYDTGYIQSMIGSASPVGLISTHQMQATWALYIAKFINSYEKNGIDIWAITPQNEPENDAPWESCKYTPAFESEFIKNHLGPRLNSSHPEILIIAFDHNKDDLVMWTEAIVNNSHDTRDDNKHRHSTTASSFVDGMAFHWYHGSSDRELDGTYGYNAIRKVHEMAPEMLLIPTEACSCPGVELGSLSRAERLGHDVLFDLLNFANSWIDWNLLVDNVGGPNHVFNYCDASIVCNEDFTEVVIQPRYYYFGHFSKFITPGSVRIQSNVVGDYHYQIMDPNTRAGIELGMFYCEHASRQQWMWRSDGGLQLAHPVRYVESSVPYMVALCVGSGTASRPYLRLVICKEIVTDDDTTKPSKHPSQNNGKDNNRKENQDGDAGSLNPEYGDEPLEFGVLPSGQIFEMASKKCVVLADGGDENGSGALLALGRCEATATVFLTFNGITQEIILVDTLANSTNVGNATANVPLMLRSVTDNPLCLTAGWPFLTSVAFVTPSDETVVVILNEASESTNIVVNDVDRGRVWFGIPGNSIQTIVY